MRVPLQTEGAQAWPAQLHAHISHAPHVNRAQGRCPSRALRGGAAGATSNAEPCTSVSYVQCRGAFGWPRCACIIKRRVAVRLRRWRHFPPLLHVEKLRAGLLVAAVCCELAVPPGARAQGWVGRGGWKGAHRRAARRHRGGGRGFGVASVHRAVAGLLVRRHGTSPAPRTLIKPLPWWPLVYNAEAEWVQGANNTSYTWRRSCLLHHHIGL